MSAAKRPDAADAQHASAFEAAIAWVEWLDRHPDDADGKAAFQKWHDASPEHREAFARARRTWGVLGEVADNPVVAAWRDQARKEGTRRPRAWASIAAAVVIAAGAAFAFYLREVPNGSVAREDAPQIVSEERAVRVATTAVGERQHLLLSDGTRLTLNTSSHVEIDYRGGQRRVRLVGGEAMFDVAKDPHRPFIVTAADRQVVALGTQFGVRIDGQAMRVTLLEGRVAVKPANADDERSGSAIAPIELVPGQQLVSGPERTTIIRDADVTRATSWQEGWIVLNRDPVRVAVEEVSRYTRERITYDDPRIAELSVSGTFRTGEVDDFLSALTEVHPISIEHPRTGEAHLVWRE